MRSRENGSVSSPLLAIPLSVPEIRGNEWKYIKECLDTGWVSSVGSFVERFEQEVAMYVGARYGVATSSGTAALHIALKIAGVQTDDEVLVSTLSFIAPANAVRYLGAWPVFIDAESQFWQMDPEKVELFLKRRCHWLSGKLVNRATGRRVRAILPVHILGHPCDMTPILELARANELSVVEDATESLGASYKDQAVGNLGHVACFSFNGNKILTTGGGGMLVTDREDWARRARYLTTQAKDDPVEYIHHEIGYNYRLTNIQAAMGCAQLEQLDGFLCAKRTIAAAYRKEIDQIAGLSPMRQAGWAKSSCWMYTVLVNEAVYGEDRKSLMNRCRQSGVETRPLWQPLHRSQAHGGCQSVGGSSAQALHEGALSLPCSVGLTKSDQHRVIELLKR